MGPLRFHKAARPLLLLIAAVVVVAGSARVGARELVTSQPTSDAASAQLAAADAWQAAVSDWNASLAATVGGYGPPSDVDLFEGWTPPTTTCSVAGLEDALGELGGNPLVLSNVTYYTPLNGAPPRGQAAALLKVATGARSLSASDPLWDYSDGISECLVTWLQVAEGLERGTTVRCVVGTIYATWISTPCVVDGQGYLEWTPVVGMVQSAAQVSRAIKVG